MTQVVAQGDGLGQILVEPQAPGNGPGDAGHLQGVGHAGAVVVSLRLEEDLGLVHEPAEGFGVDDPVNVPLVAGADGAGGNRPQAAFGRRGQGGIGRQGLLFQFFRALSQGHSHPSPLPKKGKLLGFYCYIRKTVQNSC